MSLNPPARSVSQVIELIWPLEQIIGIAA